MPNKKLIVLFLCSLGGAAGAAEPGPFYIGASGGVRSDFDSRWSGEDSHASGGGKLYAGYEFDTARPFAGSMLVSAIEVAGFSSGRSRGNETGSDALKGASVVYKASLRDSGRLAAHARLGVAYVDSSHQARDRFGYSYTRSGAGMTGGLGLSYALDQRWALNADVDRLKSQDNNLKHVNTVNIGPSYRF